MTLDDLMFKAEDAQCELEMGWRGGWGGGDNTITPMISIDEANRILREKLEKADKVYFNLFSGDERDPWSFTTSDCLEDTRTHTARLVCIERKS